MSLTTYAGSSQFLGVELLARLAPLTEVAFLVFVINFRHMVYGLSMLDKFRGMGARKLYMIASLTDETYALLAGVETPDGVDEKEFYFSIALLDHLYWIGGSVLGSVAGSLITINTEGIDFAMTALFITVFIDQWRNTKQHSPAITGVCIATICLLLFGPTYFLIPTLLVITICLSLLRKNLEKGAQESGS
jgi:4-azaleucine resistance transporter AzlC